MQTDYTAGKSGRVSAMVAAGFPRGLRTLLITLRRKGLTLTSEGDSVRIAPASKLTEADRAAIRANKAELLRMLRAGMGTVELDCSSCGNSSFLFNCGRCPRCNFRRCSGCGNQTGSFLIEQCVICGQLEDER